MENETNIRITVMSMDGQAFLEDSSGTLYYKHRLEEEIRRPDKYDSHPMNTQNLVPVDKKLYEDKRFKTLQEADRYISKTALEAQLEDMKSWEPKTDNANKVKESAIQALEQQLARCK